MRNLHTQKQRVAPKNRLKKQSKPRKPINYRSFLRKLAKVACGAALVSLAGLSGYELYRLAAKTTFLSLERIEVTNLKRLSRQEVVALAGVKQGDAMLALRLQSIGEQIAKNPWIEKVKIRRYFPDTLTIEVAEREPVAVVSMGYLYYLDTKGEIFKPLNEGDRLDYPVLTGISEEDMGKDPSGSKAMLKVTLELIAQLKSRTDFRLDDISEIHYDKGYGFTLFTASGGVPVKLGNDNFGEKLARFARIYRDLQAQMPTLQYIDLDYSDKIIVKKA
jgi:cell division protein FtsQ